MSFLFKAMLLLMLGGWGRRRAMKMLVGRTPANAPGQSAFGGLRVAHHLLLDQTTPILEFLRRPKTA